jgi:hypothetical protein
MDPNETLAQIRQLAAQGGELGDLVIGLDHWLSTCGFLPTAWSVKPQPGDPPRAKPATTTVTQTVQPTITYTHSQ